MMRTLAKSLLAVLMISSGCGVDGADEDGRDDEFTTGGKLDGFEASAAETAAVLRLVNTASLGELDDEVGLSSRAAEKIVEQRVGVDGRSLTFDDDTISTLGELDAVFYVGPVTFGKLLDHVHAAKLVPDEPPVTWHVDPMATGDDARFAVSPSGTTTVLLKKSDMLSLQLQDGTTVGLPDDVAVAGAMPQIAIDELERVHLFYPLGTKFGHATLRSGTWMQHEALEGEQLIVEQGPRGQIYALAGLAVPHNEGFSQLLISAMLPGGFANTTVMWQARMSPENHSLGVGADGRPAIAFDKNGLLRQSQEVPSGWGSRDIHWDASEALVTTGGQQQTIVSYSKADQVLRIYRPDGEVFYSGDRLTTAKPTSLDAVLDARGAAHVCYAAEGKATHVMVAADSAETVTSLGAGDQCKLALDDTGAVHLFVRAGDSIRHGML
jgi:hypothetical protein